MIYPEIVMLTDNHTENTGKLTKDAKRTACSMPCSKAVLSERDASSKERILSVYMSRESRLRSQSFLTTEFIDSKA